VGWHRHRHRVVFRVVVCDCCDLPKRLEDLAVIWEPTISPEAYAIESQLVLPDGIKLFDIHINPSGSMLFFLEILGERSTLAIAPGDDPVGRFHRLLEDTMKSKLDKEDQKELAKMGKKGFIAHEKSDIKAAKSEKKAPKKKGK
jgi:hypothetical protein